MQGAVNSTTDALMRFNEFSNFENAVDQTSNAMALRTSINWRKTRLVHTLSNRRKTEGSLTL